MATLRHLSDQESAGQLGIYGQQCDLGFRMAASPFTGTRDCKGKSGHQKRRQCAGKAEVVKEGFLEAGEWS